MLVFEWYMLIKLVTILNNKNIRKNSREINKLIEEALVFLIYFHK